LVSKKIVEDAEVFLRLSIAGVEKKEDERGGREGCAETAE
jgi:hypothetical protein